MLIDTLKKVGLALNEEKIRWGIGGSVLLFAHGIVDFPRDIDILVHQDDSKKAADILSTLGKLKERTPSDSCISDEFYEFSIGGIDVEIISGFTIKHDQGLYKYVFSKKSTPERLDLDHIEIPLMSLEDWYVIYQVLPDREEKVALIERFLSSRGLKYPHHLTRQFDFNLPDNVSEHIEKFISMTFL
ncbi:MAG: nucleotidyltransferase family protein [Tissierellales bacterium]|jgi:hypothetical protein|nr:nucleotidyltransferase family protein [Tissierellales bacterium]